MELVEYKDDCLCDKPAEEIIHILCDLDGRERSNAIGITLELCKDKSKAQRWYYDIVKRIHPDVYPGERSELAMSKLSELYSIVSGDL